jgi:3-deoxy-7-phosphoheptulonate synthase
MVDLSHANSSKKHERQIIVAENIAEQIESGSHQIFGVMVESHLHDGAQKFTPGKDDPAKLEYGKSITDACINWDDSVKVLERLAGAVKKRRSKKSKP